MPVKINRRQNLKSLNEIQKTLADLKTALPEIEAEIALDQDNILAKQIADEKEKAPPVKKAPVIKNKKKAPSLKDQERSRGYCFTDFTCDHQFWEDFFDDPKNNVKYLVYGEETCESTDRTHFQGFIYYNTQRKYGATKKKLAPHHIEIMGKYSSPGANRKYCLKGTQPKDDWLKHKDKSPLYGRDVKGHEFGVCPNQGERSDIATTKLMMDEGKISNAQELADHSMSQFCQYGRPLKQYMDMKQKKRKWAVKVYILWGPAGSGKSRMANESTDCFLTISGDPKNPFVSGYDGEDIVCFDDFDPSMLTRESFLKLTDGFHPYRINIKGGTSNWKPTEIYFTTNIDPRTWYGGRDESINRRVTARYLPRIEAEQAFIEMPSERYDHATKTWVVDNVPTQNPLADDLAESILAKRYAAQQKNT